MRAGKSNSHLGVSNLSLVGVLGGNLVCIAVKLVKLVGTIFYISISRRNNPLQPWRLDVWTVRCSAETETHVFSATIIISATLALKIGQASHRPTTVTSLIPTAVMMIVLQSK